MKRVLVILVLSAMIFGIMGSQSTVRADNGAYIVQSGDTLLTIASRYGVSVSSLAGVNGLNWNSWVYIGQRLSIPGQTGGNGGGDTGSTYTVARGDTLYSIARRFGVAVSALQSVNGLTNANFIYSGQQLTIPDGSGNIGTPAYSGEATKWIDVNLSTQTLIAYEGQNPVFSAAVSTGTWNTPTVVGTFTVQSKYVSTLMTGGGGTSYYYLPNVPYVMYFYGGYAIHGTYWHSNFGTPMSHGCVNMSTANAGWLFSWAPVDTKVVTHY